ncbi:MAG: LytR family transcriptional regulator [Roseiflexus castenholzii]|uniref:LCP family protein n=1 Tax=Roseiflexus castenholzii TaxID=120962 RepID=UPI000CC2E7BA|nr:MAG: LytR family transcriptional regulator [Roseiflexus castenholzii]
MADDHQRRSIRGTTTRERIAARRRARRANQWSGFALVFVALAALALLTIGVTALRRAEQTLAELEQDDPRQRATATLPSPTTAPQTPPSSTVASPAPAEYGSANELLARPFTVLLLGVDRRTDPDEGVRSDTLMLVRVDPQVRTVSMLSIPRDSVVPVPRLGWAKINAAYGYGYANAATLYGDSVEPSAAGGALAAEAVEQFLGVTIDYIAQVDFRGFERLVDSVGGVLIDVPSPILDAEYPTENYGVERIYIPAGLQVLDGRTALIYARTRHGSSDFERSKRQQQVLRALFDQVRNRGLLANTTLLPRWIEVLTQHVRTTLPVSDLRAMAELAALARDLDSSRILQLSINPNDVAIDREDGSDIYWNPNDIAALVARWEAGPDLTATPPIASLPTQVAVPDASPDDPLHGSAPTLLPSVVEPGAVVQVLNGARVEGIAGRVSAFLEKRGFVVADPETVTRVYEHTLIIDYTGRPETRRLLAEALGVNARYVLAPAPPDAPPPGYNVDIVVIVGRDYRQEWLNDGGR